MADMRASTKSLGVTAGTAIPDARKYLGCLSISAAAVTTIIVYRGGAAIAGNEIGGTNAAVGGSNSDNPNFAIDVDKPLPAGTGVPPVQPFPGVQSAAGGIFVVTTGAGGLNLIRYST